MTQPICSGDSETLWKRVDEGNENPERRHCRFLYPQMSGYEIRGGDEVLVIRARTFSPERGSVLHGGIFSKELASSFMATGLSLLFLLVVVLLGGRPGPVHYSLAVVVFIVCFVFSRIYLFSGAYLETVIDRKRACITIIRKGFFRSRIVRKPLGDLRDIALSTTKYEAEDSDAAQFVRRIAAQHGTVIPGFGERKIYHSVVLAIGEGSYSVFASKSLREAEHVLCRVRDFVSGNT